MASIDGMACQWSGVATITASISGTGTISLGGTQIKVTYLGNDKQAAMKGNYEVIYKEKKYGFFQESILPSIDAFESQY